MFKHHRTLDRPDLPTPVSIGSLSEVVSLRETKLLNDNRMLHDGGITADVPVLIVLAAGKGTRFGKAPKCIQPIDGTPLARHSIDAFRQVSAAPVICIVGYRHQEVAHALGNDNLYVCSENPAGGTAYAAFEALSVPQLQEVNPLLVITMGDRIVPSMIYRQLWETHRQGADQAEAALTLLTAHYDPPRNQGKGRILRNATGAIVHIREQKDIEAEANPETRQQQLELTEGNCPLYMIRARTLYSLLAPLTNNNAQRQYYLTDIVAHVANQMIPHGGEIRSVTVTPADPAYALLCADVTRAEDLPRLERIVKAIKSV